MTTLEEAAEVLQKEKLERAEKCNAEIAKILDKYNCRIDTVVIIRGGQLAQQLEIVAL